MISGLSHSGQTEGAGIEELAVVAEVPSAALMVGEGYGAVGAAEHMAAVVAHQEGGEAAAVEKEQRLARGGQVLFESGGQLGEEGGILPSPGVQQFRRGHG